MSRLEGADISIQDFLEENEGLSQSNLQRAFNKTSILLTGVTSFVGSVVLEKLLRSCPEIDCIFVLIRNKNGKEPVERLKDLFKLQLFDRLKMENPNSISKVHVIPCDFFENDLGLSNDDYLLLTSKINAVIHTARIIGSNIKLKEAVLINLKALQSLLKLCNEMKKLDAFAYLSSVFAHFNERIIEEKIYPCPLTGDGLINMVDNLSDDLLEAITPGITGECPNISTLTLAVAERTLNDKGDGLPLCIVRPPFVLASCQEPIAGWIQPQKQETPTEILLNLFLGKLFTIHCDGRKPAEIVPVDKVANLIIAAVGNLLLRRKEWINQAVIISNNLKRSPQTQSDFQDIQVYNIILSNKQKLSWSEFFVKSVEHVEEVPFLDTLWHTPLQMNKYWIVHWLFTWLHFGQIILFDLIKRILGIQSKRLETFESLLKMCDSISIYCKKHWHLKDDNVTSLWDSISDSDRNLFDFNLKSFDWNQFFYTQCRGLRVYLMKDPLSTVPVAKRNQQRMKYTYALLMLTILASVYLVFFKSWLF